MKSYTYARKRRAILNAYSDCQDDNENDRNLDYFCNYAFTIDEAQEILKDSIPNGYNEFSYTNLEAIKVFCGDDSLIYIARENSVCIYIKTIETFGIGELLRFREKIKADEVHIDFKLGLIRVWFD